MQYATMQYARLLSCVLIIGLMGCADSDVEKTAVSKVEPDRVESRPTPTFEFNNQTFDAPIMLMAGDETMKAGHSYPSPAMFDVDNDGDDEMVLGEIMGTVSYCENENKSGGDPVWSSVARVLRADGKPLKLHNW